MNAISPKSVENCRPCLAARSSGFPGVVLGVVLCAVFLLTAWLFRGRGNSEPATLPLPSLVGLPANTTSLPSLWLEDLTWVEIAQAQQQGYNTILIPTGGTEQNGPHLITGKHNRIVHYTAQEIATRHGRTLLAPVLSYVPEEPHLHYPGTISLPPGLFQQVAEAAGESFLKQGFQRLVLMGDSGGNQEPLRLAAESLNRRWHSQGRQIVFLSDYYANHQQEPWLHQQGFSTEDCGSHAGLADTAELMAIESAAVRTAQGLLERRDLGHDGRPELATAEIGHELLELKIAAAIQQLNRLFAESGSLESNDSNLTGRLQNQRATVVQSAPGR